MVYIVNDRRKVISSRSGDDNLLSACFDMSVSFLFLCVESCTLENYVNADLSPRKVLSVSLSIDLDLFSVNCDGVLSSLNFVESYFSK